MKPPDYMIGEHASLTYKETLLGIAVYTQGRRIGTIVKYGTGFCHVARGAGGKHRGDTMATVADVKRSLEVKP